ncbi:glycosyltransferase [Herbiconiux sp. L3-i23]|uniref:nucleotide disphospho-sugar-binding domain-containing protein n=1 Tax=Herbiconiux sp. L3-i23 TaxID=2905871 RepID=UPI00204647A2|nr:glycosyltransferase [Herbiconiux sp. L3-i23]BDI23606.1 hypothetical protein L3i23_23820 [Herbiconiux sp. L3-i23]
MTLLIVSPDYASHLLPLATLGTAWRDRGERVVVATGPSTGPIVSSFGYERIELSLGRGSNPGVMRTERQVAEEASSLHGFFEATREGMVPTLTYQARERLTDLMWDPVGKASELIDIVDRLRPDDILVDHLAYSARLGLTVAGAHYGDVVLGHPTALPVGDEVYGYPPSWPADLRPDTAGLAELRALCESVSANFTDQWNRAISELDPTVATTRDAFAAHGPVVLYNYAEQLADPARALPEHVHLGSAIRDEAVDAEVDEWLRDDAPFVYVSFGSFLSVRADVLGRVADALRRIGVRAAIAAGSTPVEALGKLPSDWLVRAFLPQVRLLGRAAASVTHGGNNSVTESLAKGVPMLVLPFSTDQFAGAAAVERSGAGLSLDPNSASVDRIADAVQRLLADRDRPVLDATRLAAAQKPGAERAFSALRSSSSDAIADGSPLAAR